MKQNLLFNRASAFGMRFIMVLTLLLTVGIGQMWGAEGDVLKTYDTNSSTFASGYGRKTGDNFVWWGQKGYYGANNATNHGNLKPTAADLPVVKAHNSSATTSTTGLYYLYTSEAVANVGKIEVNFTANSGSSTVNAYVVSSSTKAASGSATWTKVTLASNSSKAQGANVATAGTHTFTFDATETDAKYYGVVFVTSSYWRATNLTFKLYEGAPSTPATPYTVTFHTTATKEEEMEETSAGSGVTPPAMEAECGEWEFQGWSESSSNSETSTTPLSLVTLTNGKYYPTKDIDLYPVYTKTEDGGGSVEETLAQTLQYDTWSYSGSTTNKTSYRLFHSNSYVESAEFDLSTLSKVVVYGGTFGGDSYNNLTIAGVVGGTTTTWKSVTVSGNSQTGVNTYTDGTSLSGTGKLRVTSNSGSSSSSGVRISKIMIYTLQASSTTYYYSYPQCITETTVSLIPKITIF